MALSKPVETGLPNCHPFFLFVGYTQSMNDHSLFIISSEGSNIIGVCG